MGELLVVINGEPISVRHHHLRTVGSCVTEAFAKSSQHRADAHYFVRTAQGDDLSSKDRVEYLNRIFVTLDAPVNRDPGDETDFEPTRLLSGTNNWGAVDPASHAHLFHPVTARCRCGATHEQLRSH